MSEATDRSLEAGIVDFNPTRMSEDEADAMDIPAELRPLLADKRQYPLNIARHFPDGTSWLSTEQPWFFRSVMADQEQVARLAESDVLVLSGSGLSMYKYQENVTVAYSAEDRAYLERAQDLVRTQLSEGKWVLGICFGGQLAMHAVGGRIGRLPNNSSGHATTEAGWLDHQLTDAGKVDEVFGSLSEDFFAPHLHNDYVAQLPTVGSSVGGLKVARAEALAVRRGFMGENGLEAKNREFIQASVVEFDNGARLYQIQPHPEMATREKANFLVRQNPWVAKEMGDEYYQQAVQVPSEADFSVSRVITEFVRRARQHYEQTQAVRFVNSVVGQNVEQFAQYLIK